jgi:hypothetical protein
MRPSLLAALGLIATGVVAGCTLLVPFDDPPPLDNPPGDDDETSSSGRTSSGSTSSGNGSSTSSSSSSGSTTSSSGSTTSSSSSSGAAYPPACDKTGVAAITGCAGKDDGTYCGLNGTPDDNVQCQGGAAICIFHCTMGCAQVDVGIDQCADCKDKTSPDQWYCGKDVQWPGAAGSYAFECKSGHLVNEPAPCGLNKCHTVCTRASPPPLPGSCCQSTVE